MTDPVFDLEVQWACDPSLLADKVDFEGWVKAALEGIEHPVELVIRMVDEVEGGELNQRYRNMDRPTNVLSFAFEVPPGAESNHLGDLVICTPVVMREAQEQGKTVSEHLAHLVVHGVLHLCGFDHQTNDEAELMELREKTILQRLGIEDPYRQIDGVAQG
ncbi:Metal-dependent hydrolase YbeY, involved in rRNA and/or ribosome maturation and assembly [hydrothermal vent metagenome]|uniref:Metal-dependent hydrolase YbeY, involved in rRNA and/or ribosome maturation and assembly n=1 Tax=hydrothermal vent metagenome TaxID=652676 RepID=A0A3B0YMU3_9ZZZZ